MKFIKKYSKALAMLILVYASVDLVFYIKNLLADYKSVLDAYLYSTEILIFKISFAVYIGFTVFFFIAFIIALIRRNKSNLKKLIAAIAGAASLFVGSTLLLAAIMLTVWHFDGTTVYSVPPTAYSYVHIETQKDTDDKIETEFKRICDEIPVNYAVHLMNETDYASTACVQILDEKLLSAYYAEQATLCAEYDVLQFNANQLISADADKGFYYFPAEGEIQIVIVKGNTLFSVSLDNDNIKLDNTVLKQLASL